MKKVEKTLSELDIKMRAELQLFLNSEEKQAYLWMEEKLTIAQNLDRYRRNAWQMRLNIELRRKNYNVLATKRGVYHD